MSTWTPICDVADLRPNVGVAVQLPEGPFALFYMPDQHPNLYAVGHQDPFSKANVLGWGLLSEDDGEWSVASPLYKQRFSLTSGACVEDPTVSVPTLDVKIQGHQVLARR